MLLWILYFTVACVLAVCVMGGNEPQRRGNRNGRWR